MESKTLDESNAYHYLQLTSRFSPLQLQFVHNLIFKGCGDADEGK